MNSIRRKSGQLKGIPLALKRKKSLNELMVKTKSITKTIQMPSEAFKPLCGNKENMQDSQLEDMEIDENHDINAAKARTLV